MKEIKDRIELSDFKKEDINKKIDIINDSKNNTYLHYELPLEYKKTLNWFNNKNNDNRLDCTVYYDNEICGFIGLLGIDKEKKEAEYYICIDHNFSGKGIGKDASDLLLKYSFNNLGLQKIYLYTEEDNKKAQHLFEKIGFKQECLIENDITYNDKSINRYLYSINKENTNV